VPVGQSSNGSSDFTARIGQDKRLGQARDNIAQGLNVRTGFRQVPTIKICPDGEIGDRVDVCSAGCAQREGVGAIAS
jgi:hypothetical protein